MAQIDITVSATALARLSVAFDDKTGDELKEAVKNTIKQAVKKIEHRKAKRLAAEAQTDFDFNAE